MAGPLAGLFSSAAGMAAGGASAVGGTATLGKLAEGGMLGGINDIAQNGLSLDGLLGNTGGGGATQAGGTGGAIGKGSTSSAQLLQAPQAPQMALQQAATQGQGGMMLDPTVIAQLASANKFGV